MKTSLGLEPRAKARQGHLHGSWESLILACRYETPGKAQQDEGTKGSTGERQPLAIGTEHRSLGGAVRCHRQEHLRTQGKGQCDHGAGQPCPTSPRDSYKQPIELGPWIWCQRQSPDSSLDRVCRSTEALLTPCKHSVGRLGNLLGHTSACFLDFRGRTVKVIGEGIHSLQVVQFAWVT